MSVVLSVYTDQIEQDYRTLTTGVPGSVTHDYTDVTSENFADISYDYTYPLAEWHVLHFRIPAPAWIDTVIINSVTIRPYVQDATTDTLNFGVSNDNHSDTTHGSLGSAATVGRKSYDITTEFNAYVADPTATWYIHIIKTDVPSDDAAIYCNGAAEGYRFYVDFDVTGIPTACTAPTSVSVDEATPAPGATVNLSWSGAAAGDWNTIVGYDVYRATSSDGEYFFYKNVTTTNTYGTTTVVSPASPGDSYYYKVKTKGSETGYDSALSTQYASVLALSTACIAPTTISLSKSVSSKPISLSWGGAYAGIGNAITAYEIQYADSADNVTFGSWTELKTLNTTETSGTYLAPINSTLGQYRCYRIKTIGTLTGYDSEWSAASDSVRTSSSTASEIPTPKLIVYEYPHVVTGVEKGAFPLGFVQKYNTLIWHRRYQGVGEFSMSLPFTEEANDLITTERVLGIAGRNELMLITDKQISEDRNTGKETIVVTGKSLVCMLPNRIITSSEQLDDHPVGHIKAILRNQPIFLEHYDEGESDYVPDINGDLDADGDRRFPDFHWLEPSFSYTGDATLVFQPQKLSPLLDTIISLCKIEGYGLRVVSTLYSATSDTLTMWFEIYKGTDRSSSQDINPHVIFDKQLRNIIWQQYTESIENKKTAGYATNASIDTLSTTDLRLVDITSTNVYSAGDQTYINAGSNPANVGGGSGMSRSELGLSVSEIEEPTTGTTDEKIQVLYDSCKQIGRNEIENSKAEQSYEVIVNPFAQNLPQYLTDFDLGDIITARNTRWGVSMDARISEAIETYEAGKKMQVSFVFGDQAITMLTRVKQIAKRRG